VRYKRPPITFRSESKARENVLVGQIRKLGEQLGLRGTRGQIAQNVVHGDPSLTNARLTTPAPRPNRDASQKIHVPRMSLGGRNSSLAERQR
jgi:hypothetical protein